MPTLSVVILNLKKERKEETAQNFSLAVGLSFKVAETEGEIMVIHLVRSADVFVGTLPTHRSALYSRKKPTKGINFELKI